MSYPAISLATATVGRHRCPQKRLQTARQPPVYPNSSPDHRACNSLTPFRCPHAVHPCPSVDSPDKVPDFLEHHVKSPRQPFGELKQMSKEVGLLDHYCTVYELTSQHAHGGAQGLPLEFLRLLDYEGIPDWEPAKTLATGIYYYDLVLSTNITVFPDLESQFADFQPGTEWHKRLETLWQTIGTQAIDNGRAAASQ